MAQNFQYLPEVDQPGSVVRTGPPEAFYRTVLDAHRSMHRRVPSAEYPDGYLGTINSRRGDRMLDSLKSTLNKKAYQRGVHKGERIDRSDYYWPPEFNMMTGLEYEARGLKFAPLQQFVPTHLVSEGKMLTPEGEVEFIPAGAKRISQLRRLSPSWR